MWLAHRKAIHHWV